MRCRVARLVCVTVALAGLPLSAGQIRPQPGMAALPDASRTSGSAAIFGRVLDAGTDAPISGAVVSIGGVSGTGASLNPGLANASPGRMTAMTNGRGQFLFRDLPAGSYTLTASAPGYLAGTYGQRRPQGSSRRVAVADGQQTMDADIRLWKTAVITGAVLDEVGDPLVQVNVRALRRRFLRGRPQWSLAANATTDDRGVFRFANLAPGDYIVAMLSGIASVPASTADAYWQAMTSDDPASRTALGQLASSGTLSAASGVWVGDQRVQTVSGRAVTPPADPDAPLFIYPRTFHPAAEKQDDASLITVGSGDERQADIRVRPVRTSRVSGIVTGPTGPAPNVRVSIAPASTRDVPQMTAYVDVGLVDTGFTTSTTTTDATGRFTLVGVPAGDYVVRAAMVKAPSGQTIVRNDDGTVTAFTVAAPVAGAGAVSRANNEASSAEMSLGVPDRDVAGVAIALQPEVNISGTVAFTGGTPPPASLLAGAVISLNAANAQSRRSTRVLNGRSTFELGPAPRGTYALSLVLPGWTMASVRLGGKEIGDGLFSLTADVDDVVITMTNRLASVAGTVQRSGGEASVAVFPADYQRWIAAGMSTSRAHLVDADKTGTFEVDGLASGDYAVAAIDASTPVDLQDPADVEALARIATRVTLGDGDRKTLSLSIGRLR
jgi:hypothetical protein